MAEQVFPTKGNLINTKKSLELARLGFELLDRKRNIIVREMMLLIDRAAEIQSSIDGCYAEAYLALQRPTWPTASVRTSPNPFRWRTASPFPPAA